MQKYAPAGLSNLEWISPAEIHHPAATFIEYLELGGAGISIALVDEGGDIEIGKGKAGQIQCKANTRQVPDAVNVGRPIDAGYKPNILDTCFSTLIWAAAYAHFELTRQLQSVVFLIQFHPDEITPDKG